MAKFKKFHVQFECTSTLLKYFKMVMNSLQQVDVYREIKNAMKPPIWCQEHSNTFISFELTTTTSDNGM